MEFSKVLFLLGICLFTATIALLVVEIFNIINYRKLLEKLINMEEKNGTKRKNW